MYLGVFPPPGRSRVPVGKPSLVAGGDAAAAGGAYHTADGATGGVPVASKAAFANGSVPTAVAADPMGEVGDRAASVSETTTATDCIALCQVTPGVTCDTAAAAVADDCPPLRQGYYP